MVNVARISIEHPLYPWMIILACLLGGLWGIDSVGRLEDPKFPLKHAYVITPYAGASALETEQEVTDVIEAALQELPYIKRLTSKSLAGRSEVQVEVQEQYGEDEVQQIWDELRRRVSEAALRLLPGAGTPLVEDDFGDVYGIVYAVATPGYRESEIRDMARFLETGLNTVPHVAKVSTAGVPEEALFVELDHERRVRLGLPLDALFQGIGAENQVLPAGSVEFGGRRLRIAPELAFDSVAAVGDMRVGRPGSVEFVRLAEIATITREAVEQPSQIIRHQGERVFTVGVSVVDDENVVEVGQAVDARMRALVDQLPIGVNYASIYSQHQVVQRSLSEFLINLGLSVLTVVAALCVFMGWRAGTVVGSVLLLTVLGTLCIMAFAGIELQRISLGALMIAMGMLVDNAIVVAEGMVTGVQRGYSPKEAAAQSVHRTQFPLLGATIIGIAAFGPIGLADDNPGHFLRSLFQVVAISLLLSWVLAVTVGPLLGSYLLKVEKGSSERVLYSGWGYAPYRRLIGFSLRHAWLATLVLVTITFSCLWGFGYVKQGFFPTTNSPLIFVDLRLPQGTDILATVAEIERLEPMLAADPEVISISSFIGAGATRFASMVRPEQPNPAYAQLVIRIADFNTIDADMARVLALLQAESIDAEITVRRSEFTPSGTSKIEARFSGPDVDQLRTLADRALGVYLAHDLIDRKTDWRQREIALVPRFDEARARQVGVSRGDLAQGLAYATTGVRIGLFREGENLLPIVARAPFKERVTLQGVSNRQVWSQFQQTYVPLAQVISGIELEAEDSMIFRRERTRTIAAQANPPAGHNANRVFNQVRAEVEAIPLPPGYALEWGGEFEANRDAMVTLNSRIPTALAIMLLVTVLMFGRIKQPLVIWLTVPMIVCGVVVSLLATDLAFTFPSFLGFLSLSGMLIKNCIVLVDEIDKRLDEGEWTLATVVEASVSRLRPVMLAAGTTIAGMSPLLRDAFFKEMAVCIMGGLAFATLLTLVAVPVFYRIAMGKRLRTGELTQP
ncbi:MAG: efflux RND transporter permease subunit [Pseudomonadales bacterium]|nr:efflux RND transporter permease subunit [Pseudomonadales bacterium]